MVNRRLFSAVPSYSRSFPDTKPKGLSPSVLKQRAFACHPMCEPRHLEPHMFYRKKHLEILLKTPFKDGKRVLFWRSDCCLGFRPTTLALRGPCTACCLGRTCRWPTKEACGRRTACLEGECSKEAPICLYLTSFFVHMCADGKPPPRNPHSDLWLDLFHTLLNIPDSGSLPSLRSLRCRMNTVLQENYGNKLPTLKSRLVVLLLENRKTVRR